MDDGRGGRRPGPVPWHLTRREGQVLSAVGQRWTNAEIAADLHISKRTVESHVSSLLAKLGVGDRLSLVRAVTARSDPPPGGPGGQGWPCAAAADPPRAAPAAVPRPPLVGRDAEREVLLDRLAELRGGSGAVVLLSGEPGIGKTRLVEELVTVAESSGVRCLVGRCRGAQEQAPLAPVAELLDAALRAPTPVALGALLEGDAEPLTALVPRLHGRLGTHPWPAAERSPLQLVAAAVATLARLARAAPLVVVLEDVHRADPATVEVLRRLCEAASEAPVLVVVTRRDGADDEPDPAPHRVPVHAVALGALDEAAVGRVLAALTGAPVPAAVRRALHRRTGGNPFFLEEVLALIRGANGAVDGLRAQGPGGSAVDAVPVKVRLAVQERLAGMSGPARTVLQAAALLGERVDTAVLVHALGEPGSQDDEAADRLVRDAVSEALAEGVLVATDPLGGAAFRHDLVREVLVGQVSPPRRRRTHLRLAAALVAVGSSQDTADLEVSTAEHLLGAEELAQEEQVLERCLVAGRRCLDRSDALAALRYLEHAEGLVAAVTHPHRGELHLALATARSRTGRPEEAVSSWERAVDAFEQSGDLAAVGAVSGSLGLTLPWAALGARGHRLVVRSAQLLTAGADDLLRAGPDGELQDDQLAVALARLGVVRTFGGDTAGGAELLGRAEQLLDRLDPRAASAVLSDVARSAHAAFETARAADAGQRGAELARQVQDDALEADGLWEAAWDLAALGRFAEAAAASARLDELAGALGGPGLLACAGRARGVLEVLSTGDLDGYADLARRDTALVRDRLAGAWLGTAHAFSAHAQLLAGRWEDAAALLALGPVGCGPALAGFCTGARLVVVGHLRRRTEVLAVLAGAAADLPVLGRRATGGAWGLALGAVEALALVGLHERAGELYPTVLEAQRTSGALVNPFPPLQLLDRVCGTAAACAGRWEEAEEHFAKALRDAEQAPFAVELPETRRALATALHRRGATGDAERVRDLLQAAAADYDRLRMVRHADLARSLLSAPGRGAQLPR